MFETEAEMIQCSILNLKKTFFDADKVRLIQEAPGLFGIPDVVLKAEKVIAIEYKLSNWKRAMIQAFKYKNFANASFVILDKDFHHRASRNIDSFKLSKIGLGYVDETGDIFIEYDPGTSEPFSDKSVQKINTLFTDERLAKVV